jgi:tetratricopeptide (TPR) repeat protein
MVLLFIITGFYNGAFRAERRERAEEHARMARTLSDYGYYQQAIEHYREALTYARDNLEYQLGLAVALYDLERYKEAENRLLDLQEGHPTLAVVNRLLARIAAREGRLDEAVSYYRTAIFGQWPRDPEENRLATRFELVDLLRSQRENTRAVSELLDLMKEAPARPDVQKRIGRLFLETGAPENALPVFDSLVKHRPNDVEAQVGYAQAEFDQGNYAAAQAGYARALRLNPGDADVQSQLALCEDINRLDPMRRGIGLSTRHRRSVEVVLRTLALVEACLNPAGVTLVGPPPLAPPDMRPIVTLARELRRGKRQLASEETIEANISLAQRLWQARERLCSSGRGDDPALQHVLATLQR